MIRCCREFSCKFRGGWVPKPAHWAHQKANANREQPGPRGMGLNTWGKMEETIRQVEDMMVIRSGSIQSILGPTQTRIGEKHVEDAPLICLLYSLYKTMLNLTDWTIKFATCSSVLGCKTTPSKWLQGQLRQTQKANNSFRKDFGGGKCCLRGADDQTFLSETSVLTNSNLANKQQPG